MTQLVSSTRYHKKTRLSRSLNASCTQTNLGNMPFRCNIPQRHTSSSMTERVCQALFVFVIQYEIAWHDVEPSGSFDFPYYLVFFSPLNYLLYQQFRANHVPFFLSLSLSFLCKKGPQLPGPSAWRAVKRDLSADELKLESLPEGECSRHGGNQQRGEEELISKSGILWHNAWLICLNTTKTIHSGYGDSRPCNVVSILHSIIANQSSCVFVSYSWVTNWFVFFLVAVSGLGPTVCLLLKC